MRTRDQMIEALRTRLQTPPKPVLAEGSAYQIELASSETVVCGVLVRIVDDSPLGRGFSFQLPDRRVFIYERDLRPGPGGILLAMA